MAECPGTTHELGKTALAFAESSMAGRALLGVDLRAPLHRAFAGGQAHAVAAAHVDIPSGDLLRRGFGAIAKIAGLRCVSERAGGKDHRQTESCGELTRAGHRTRSRPASPARSGSNCCDRPNWFRAVCATL